MLVGAEGKGGGMIFCFVMSFIFATFAAMEPDKSEGRRHYLVLSHVWLVAHVVIFSLTP